jgi:GcrA cell cycle regulator
MNDISWTIDGPWSELAMVRLRELADQKSCSEIARVLNREFRTAFTRNAVIGKLARMGINKAKRTDIVQPHVPRNRKGNGTGTKAKNLTRILAIAAGSDLGDAGLPPEPQIAEIDPAHACTLHGLTNMTCRWPHGDPQTAEFHYCGTPDADLAAGRPYCRAHARVARGVPYPRAKVA